MTKEKENMGVISNVSSVMEDLGIDIELSDEIGLGFLFSFKDRYFGILIGTLKIVVDL
jgi:hypothetical protein